MADFFCADNSRHLKEDIIGTAGTHQIYILVECRTPWPFNAFESQYIPANLKDLVKEVNRAKLSVRFLLIYSNTYNSLEYTRLLIFKREYGLCSGYSKQEFHLENIANIACIVRKYLDGNNSGIKPIESQTRDILVCTHGSHDKCCAKYGNVFYRQAISTISSLSPDSSTRIWQASHFGGHRFAPTAIDFPEGRYYGVLDRISFVSILTRTGDISCLNKVYRGWAILPNLAQILERELILLYGWDWFKYKVAGKIIEQNEDKSINRVEIFFSKPDLSLGKYNADLIRDEGRTVYLRGDCNSTKTSRFFKYSVHNLHLEQKK
jgi:hypothetical protein